MANWFVGLPVEGGDWLAPLLDDAPSDVRRFAPGDLHITVAFLGSVGEEKAITAWRVREDATFAPCLVRLAGLVPMGNPRRPTALSVVLDRGKDEAVAIIRALRDPMIEAAGARPDRYEPKPHITVARPARKASSPERKRAVAWATAKEPLGVELTIDTLALYTWSDDRRTRQFKIVESRALGG